MLTRKGEELSHSPPILLTPAYEFFLPGGIGVGGGDGKPPSAVRMAEPTAETGVELRDANKTETDEPTAAASSNNAANRTTDCGVRIMSSSSRKSGGLDRGS
jgi:hypothetical protein